MVVIRKGLWPVKAHYFFFFAALGPLLPQINVFGRQLGISPDVMGMVTAILPILWAMAKPLFGYLVDYFQKQRKLIFIGIILIMSGSYCFLYFLPDSPIVTGFHIVEAKDNPWLTIRPLSSICHIQCPDMKMISLSCGWSCGSRRITENNESETIWMNQWDLYVEQLQLQNNSLVYLDDLYYSEEKYNVSNGCEFFFMNNYNNQSDMSSDTNMIQGISTIRCTFKDDCPTFSCALLREINLSPLENLWNVTSNSTQDPYEDFFLYASATFWGFVILMCTGTVAFNVASCISDAICFDVLGGERNMKYGYQRAWGTVGYGVTALIAGWMVDWASGDSLIKNFTPAFILCALFTIIDIYFCKMLKLPNMSRPEGAGSTLSLLLSRPSVLIFLFFAVIAGMFDSFIVYYMFWFLEELALQTGHMNNIKLLEGLTVAAESFGGELIFFIFSGKILKRFGFGRTLTFCLLCYGIRFILISLITNPWQILPIELIMQGPSYALTYSTIVGYAAAVAPPGLSATLQGIVAGMDDGVGFAVGSLLGGQLYKHLGGRAAFQFFGVVAVVASAGHAILVGTFLKNYIKKPDDDNSDMKDDSKLPEHGNLLDKTLNGKIVSFSSLEKVEIDTKQDLPQTTPPPYLKINLLEMS